MTLVQLLAWCTFFSSYPSLTENARVTHQLSDRFSYARRVTRDENSAGTTRPVQPAVLSNASTRTPPSFRNTSSEGKVHVNRRVETSSGNITSVNFLNLTTPNLTRCFQQGQTLEFHSLLGHISFHTESEAVGLARSQRCTVRLNVPSGMLLDMWVSVNRADLQLHISSDGRSLFNSSGRPSSYYCGFWFYEIFILQKQYAGDKVSAKERDEKLVSLQRRCKDAFNRFHFARVRSLGNYVTAEINYPSHRGVQADVLLFFRCFTPELEVTFTSLYSGYVQSPGWDGQTHYPRDINDRARVDAPVNHSVMISFVQLWIQETRFSCDADRLTLTIGVQDTLVLCNAKPVPNPQVVRVNRLTFHFCSDSFNEQLGFKLLFSFHHASATPMKTATGRWNCSVKFWPRFQQHIRICNTIGECYAGEDEANCSHVTQHCGQGSFAVGDGCYILVAHPEMITWSEAATECRRHDAYFASLNDPDEWNDVLDAVLQMTHSPVYFGLQIGNPEFPELYQKSTYWEDGHTVLYYKIFLFESPRCSLLSRRIHERNTAFGEMNVLSLIACNMKVADTFLCEKRPTENSRSNDLVPEKNRLQSVLWRRNSSHVACPAGHVTLNFLACDFKSKCWARGMGSSSCHAPIAPLPPSFVCSSGFENVPYTLVCDHRPDCSDDSDEIFCRFPVCLASGKFQCSNKQCVPQEYVCDKINHCLDYSDESNCFFSRNNGPFCTTRPPAVIDFTGNGNYDVKSIKLRDAQSGNSGRSVCPQTHFLCPGNVTYCLPAYARCNNVFDCLGREDEMQCDDYTCPGFYRCRASSTCVHPSHVCDRVFQCPQHDDELLCNFACPANCVCHGLAFFCSGPFPADQFPELRFLDGHDSGIAPEELRNNSMLTFLDVSDCGLNRLTRMDFPNLKTLDVSRNRLRTIEGEDLAYMNNLKQMSLVGNPLTRLFAVHDAYLRFSSLQFLDMSNVSLTTVNFTSLSIFPKLVLLNLSGCGVQRLTGFGLPVLKSLDLRGCQLKILHANMLKSLQNLTALWADNYKLCCPAILPRGFLLNDCHSPTDEISSCDSLLRSDFYRISLSVLSVFALLGNLGSFVYRVFVKKLTRTSGFGVFVNHLCVSDFLMGVYLALVGVADRLFLGSYLWNDVAWKNSAACKAAGFLSLLSSEVSAFIICLITLDRFLVLRFPFSQLRFRKQSAHASCGIAWAVGIALAGVPLLPVTSHWEYYGQTGICIPLPITRHEFSGHGYSFGVTIILNFVLFLLIAAGQASIYWSVRINSLTAADSTKTSRDLIIARRLITIAVSDFLCWFPIGLLGLLVANDVPVPGVFNVVAAVFILPVNSAINPFLYTLNTLLERRRQVRERQRQKVVSAMARNDAENAGPRAKPERIPCTKEEALKWIETWVTGGLVSVDCLEEHLCGRRKGN